MANVNQEEGVIAELNLNDGDVIEVTYVYDTSSHISVGEVITINGRKTPLYGKEYYNETRAKLISRAQVKFKDMTTQEERDLLKGHFMHGRKVEVFTSRGVWVECYPKFVSDACYRLKPQTATYEVPLSADGTPDFANAIKVDKE